MCQENTLPLMKFQNLSVVNFLFKCIRKKMSKTEYKSCTCAIPEYRAYAMPIRTVEKKTIYSEYVLLVPTKNILILIPLFEKTD